MPAATPGVRFVAADRSHDAGIRQLLRESPMRGELTVSLRREPDYFRSISVDGPEHCTVVALEANERVVCAGSVAIRERYFNGRVARVGYLGNLRLAASHAGRFDILRQGYRFFDSQRQSLNVDTFFTSIAADNERALRLLQRDVAGLPNYRPVGELVTLLVSSGLGLFVSDASSSTGQATLRRGKLRLVDGDRVDEEQLPALLNATNAAYQYAPAWRVSELHRLMAEYNLGREPFHVLAGDGGYVGCAALWDQRAFKQAVVTRYGRRLALARPFYNALARVTQRVPLPAVGRAMPLGFVSHLAMPLDRPKLLDQLLLLLMAPARQLGIKILVLGLDARDPRLPSLMKRFRPRAYRTRLYSVKWPGDAATADSPDGRLLYPEVSLL